MAQVWVQSEEKGWGGEGLTFSITFLRQSYRIPDTSAGFWAQALSIGTLLVLICVPLGQSSSKGLGKVPPYACGDERKSLSTVCCIAGVGPTGLHHDLSMQEY
eukprot:1157758-Pelagomonas_calceolata.AAC.7